MPRAEPYPSGEEGAIRSSRWSAIARRTIYFGHQSVGADVCLGVQELAGEYTLPLRVVQTREPESVSGPAFVHFLAGRHRDYASKNAAVLRLLESPTRAREPVVLLKYCYGDITSPRQYASMFDAYRDTVETIQFDHPDVTLVHTTIPLTTVESGLRARTKRYLGMRSDREAAVARHRYNELLRTEFASVQPIFDLARVQATTPDGVVSGFGANGSRIETSAHENTIGGVGLSPRCRRVAAEALLDVLSTAVGGT